MRDRFLDFEALCRAYADEHPATVDWPESLAEIFRKDAERTGRDARIIAESRALLARSYEARGDP
jgi:hypothetical protein